MTAIIHKLEFLWFWFINHYCGHYYPVTVDFCLICSVLKTHLMSKRVAETAMFSHMWGLTDLTCDTSSVCFVFAGMPRNLMRLDAKNLAKDTAFGHRYVATRTWGTSDDGVGIAVSSTSASVCPQFVDYRKTSSKHANENGTITARSPTVLEGQR